MGGAEPRQEEHRLTRMRKSRKMPESSDLAKIRRDALLRALLGTADRRSGVLVSTAQLAKDLDLAIPQLEPITKQLSSEGIISVKGDLFPVSVALTVDGLPKAVEVTDRPRPIKRSRIIFIDTEPDVVRRVKAAGHEVFDVSMGYRTGKRNFTYPPPNEVDLIVSDLRQPACFDRDDWGPGGRNNNFECEILPQGKINNKFYVRDGRRRAAHGMILESQLGPQIPGAFGAREIARAIVEASVPFLIFLNPEWLSRTETFPGWLEAKWSFAPTTATQVKISEPLTTLFPELGDEVRFKLAIQNLVQKGPEFSQPQPRFQTSAISLVTNNIGIASASLFGWASAVSGSSHPPTRTLTSLSCSPQG